MLSQRTQIWWLADLFSLQSGTRYSMPCIYQKRHFASTRSRHEERNVLHFPPTYNSKLDTVLKGLVSLLRNFYQRPSKKLEALWNKITVYLCCKWRCYDMRLNSSLTETMLWAEGGESWANNGQQDHQEK